MLVRENLNEFERTGDVKKNLGIGIKSKLEPFKLDNYEHSSIVKRKIKSIFGNDEVYWLGNEDSYSDVYTEMKNIISKSKKITEQGISTLYETPQGFRILEYAYDFYGDIGAALHFKPYKNYKILEELGFERTGDVKKSLGIGKKEKIKKWFKENLPSIYFEIRDDVMFFGKKRDNVVYAYHSLRLSNREVDFPFDSLNARGLVLENSRVKNLPSHIKLTGKLSLVSSNVKELPKDLHVKNLFISFTGITHIPSTVKVDNHIYTDKSKYKLDIPKKFESKIKYDPF